MSIINNFPARSSSATAQQLVVQNLTISEATVAGTIVHMKSSSQLDVEIGTFVNIDAVAVSISISTQSGITVPTEGGSVGATTRAPATCTQKYFVMPNEPITLIISE